MKQPIPQLNMPVKTFLVNHDAPTNDLDYMNSESHKKKNNGNIVNGLEQEEFPHILPNSKVLPALIMRLKSVIYPIFTLSSFSTFIAIITNNNPANSNLVGILFGLTLWCWYKSTQYDKILKETEHQNALEHHDTLRKSSVGTGMYLYMGFPEMMKLMQIKQDFDNYLPNNHAYHIQMTNLMNHLSLLGTNKYEFKLMISQKQIKWHINQLLSEFHEQVKLGHYQFDWQGMLDLHNQIELAKSYGLDKQHIQMYVDIDKDSACDKSTSLNHDNHMDNNNE